MKPKIQAYIENVKNGNIKNQSYKVYQKILKGVDTIGEIAYNLALPKSTITARIDKLCSAGLIQTLGVKTYCEKSFTRYVRTPEGTEEIFAEKYANKKMLKRMKSFLDLYNGKNKEELLKEYKELTK